MNWRRAAVGVCTATALAVGAGLAVAPIANAAPTADPTTTAGGLLSGTVGGVVGGLIGSPAPTSTPTPTPTPSVPTTSPTSTSTSPVTVDTGSGVGVTVGTGGGGVVGVQLGGVVIGVGGTGTVSGGGSATPTPAPTSTSTPAPTSSPTSSPSPAPAAPATLTALSVTPQYQTVYPARDGYRDTDGFQLTGTTSDGQQHAADGTATLTFGSSTVRTWPITATNQLIVWDGLLGGQVVPGAYTFTAVVGDADGHRVSGSTGVVVSAQRITSATTVFTSKSVSGTHTMAAKPRAGLSKGKVYLTIVSRASGVKGKQYLVFTHAGKHLKVRIRNGVHTSVRLTIPKSFTTFTISHTWKKGTVTISSLKYRYSYKALK